MGAKQRVYRSRINSTKSLKKIFSAMELIATSRIAKARARVKASTPYAQAITRAVSALATHTQVDHVLTSEKQEVKRAAVLLITGDRGMAGAYSSNVIREGERLTKLLEDKGIEVVPYLVGRKAIAFYKYRHRATQAQWSGFSEAPEYKHAKEIGQTLVAAFTAGSDNGGVDEIHVVYTEFINMVTQTPQVIRMLPIEVVEGVSEPGPKDLIPLYDFEPSVEQALDGLLPKYFNSRIFNCMLQANASEQAARQRAMKTASDNAQDLIRTYTRLANQARQAEITQEISEIVGGADALASAGASH